MSFAPKGQSVVIDSSIAQRAINRADQLKAREEEKAYRDKVRGEDVAWRETVRQDNLKTRDANNEWRNYQQTQIINTNAAQESLNSYIKSNYLKHDDSTENFYSNGKFDFSKLTSPLDKKSIANDFNTFAGDNNKADIRNYAKVASDYNSNATLHQANQITNYYAMEQRRGRKLKDIHKDFRNPQFEAWYNRNMGDSSNPAVQQAMTFIPYEPKGKSDYGLVGKMFEGGGNLVPSAFAGGAAYWADKSIKDIETGAKDIEKRWKDNRKQYKQLNKDAFEYAKDNNIKIKKDGTPYKTTAKGEKLKIYKEKLAKLKSFGDEGKRLKNEADNILSGLDKRNIKNLPKPPKWLKNIKNISGVYAAYSLADYAGDKILGDEFISEDIGGGDVAQAGLSGAYLYREKTPQKVWGKFLKALKRRAPKLALKMGASSAIDGPLPFGELAALGLAAWEIQAIAREVFNKE